jgi:hypothetical protein
VSIEANNAKMKSRRESLKIILKAHALFFANSFSFWKEYFDSLFGFVVGLNFDIKKMPTKLSTSLRIKLLK